MGGLEKLRDVLEVTDPLPGARERDLGALEFFADIAGAQAEVQPSVAEQVDVSGVAREQCRRIERRIQHVGAQPDS